MSFLPVNLVLLSVPPLALQPQTLPRFWAYLTTTDDVATVSASGYFNADPGALLQDLTFNVGDQIYCVCSDASVQLFLTAVGTTGTTTTAVSVGINSVTTADIQDGAIINTKVNAAAAIDFSKLAALASGHIIVGSAGTVPTSVAMSGDVAIIASGATTVQNNAITTVKILNANVTLAKLSAGITPSHVVKFAANYTTTGGAAAEAIAVVGALNTDLAFVQLVAPGTNTVTVSIAVMTADTLTVTFSGDPGADAIINYQILRAAA